MQPTEEQRQQAREIAQRILWTHNCEDLTESPMARAIAEALLAAEERGKRDGVSQAAGILEERAMRLIGGGPRVVKADRMLAGEFTYAAKEIREALGGSVEPASPSVEERA